MMYTCITDRKRCGVHTYRLKMKIWFANGLKYKACDIVVRLGHELETKAGTKDLEEVVWKYYHERVGLWPDVCKMEILEQKECAPVEGYEKEPLVWFGDKNEWLKSTC
jgi:hypothetical protein